jgi:DNA-binding GntR family transcriptional regulator
MAGVKRPATLLAAVVEHVSEAIVRGDYAPGTRLQEVRLAAELAVSRGTIREALRELDELGLVDTVPHHGSLVSRVTLRRTRELYELRIALEGFAVRLAVEGGNLGPDARAALDARLGEMARAEADGDAISLLEAERAIHREITAHSGNGLLVDSLGRVQLQTRRLLMIHSVLRSQAADEVEMHRDLVDAVFSGDPDHAEAVVRAHIRASANRVLEQIPQMIVSPFHDGLDPRPLASRDEEAEP